jgi:hypothetical protein
MNGLGTKPSDFADTTRIINNIFTKYNLQINSTKLFEPQLNTQILVFFIKKRFS